MKAKLALMLVPLAIGALACQTVTSMFQDGASDQGTAVTAEARPEATNTSLAPDSDEPEGGEASQIDPCSLLTDEQIEAVHGEAPGESVRDTYDFVALGPVPSCRWPEVRLEVSLLVPPPGETAQEYYQEYIRRLDPQESPEGLGDEAWGDPQDGQVLVRQGGVYFMVEEHTYDIGNYERNQELAAMVVENLP